MLSSRNRALISIADLLTRIPTKKAYLRQARKEVAAQPISRPSTSQKKAG